MVAPTIPAMIRESHGIHGDTTNSVGTVPQLTRSHWMYTAISCPVYTHRNSPTFQSSPIISGAKRRYVISAIFPVRSTRQAMPFECDDVTAGTYVTTDLSRQQFRTNTSTPTDKLTELWSGQARAQKRAEWSKNKKGQGRVYRRRKRVLNEIQFPCSNFRRFRKITKSEYELRHVSLSV
jgi:hypothetical protein